MSRRTKIYRQFKRETVEDTVQAILHSHRPSKNVGRTLVGIVKTDTSIIKQWVPSSLPIKQEKAYHIARTLHRIKT